MWEGIRNDNPQWKEVKYKFDSEIDQIYAFRLATDTTISSDIYEMEVNIKFIVKPPTTGKFFYVDFKERYSYGIHSVEL